MKRLANLLILLSLTTALLLAQPATPKRYALVVGINAYDHDNLPDLNYAVNDADRLARALSKAGYAVTHLTDATTAKPTRAGILAALKAILNDFKAGDTIVIALAGHGVQYGKETYYCPRDAKPFETQTATLLGLTTLYSHLDEAFRGTKLILVDACRNNGERGKRTLDRKAVPAPEGRIGVLLGCAEGEEANEHDSLKHGVFFDAVARALEGTEALDPQTGEVTWDSLRTYVKREVPRKIEELYKGERRQNPNELGNLIGVPVLIPRPSTAVVVDAKPLKAPFGEKEIATARAAWAKKLGVPEKKTLDLGGGVTLDLVLIPQGVFLMGSPETEKERNDNEKQHEVELTQPFYMAVTETTQAQYRAITGESPSHFKGDTLPVEQVSWNDAVSFCEKLGKKVGAKVNLPSEAQWEYACRAGTTTVFHFGDVLNGDKANCHGDYPYGSETKGPNLEKTTPAGDARYPANGFGLRDMHGNVYEWCLDGYQKEYEGLQRINPLADQQKEDRRVLRGGSWINYATYCRAADRNYDAPEFRSSVNGFRVVVLP